MNEYVMGKLSHDRRSQLLAEAERSRLARSGHLVQAPSREADRPRGVRRQIALLLRRSYA